MRRSAAPCTIPKLGKDDRTERDVACRMLLESHTERRAFLAEQRNPGVCIEQILQESGSRSSAAPCGGRSKSPCHVPAMASSHSRYSFASEGAASAGSIVTRT